MPAPRRRPGLVARPAPAPAPAPAVSPVAPAAPAAPADAATTAAEPERRKVVIVGEYVRADGNLEPAVSKSLGIGALVLIGSILITGFALFLLVVVSWLGTYAAQSLLMSIAH